MSCIGYHNILGTEQNIIMKNGGNWSKYIGNKPINIIIKRQRYVE